MQLSQVNQRIIKIDKYIKVFMKRNKSVKLLIMYNEIRQAIFSEVIPQVDPYQVLTIYYLHDSILSPMFPSIKHVFITLNVLPCTVRTYKDLDLETGITG